MNTIWGAILEIVYAGFMRDLIVPNTPNTYALVAIFNSFAHPVRRGKISEILEEWYKGDEMKYDDFCKFYGKIKSEGACCKTQCSDMAQQCLGSVKEEFDKADKDNNGSLSFKEVCDVMERVGFKGSICEAKVRNIKLYKFKTVIERTFVEYTSCIILCFV